VFPIGVDPAKDNLFNRLKIEMPGPGYMHLNRSLTDEFIDQYAAEKAVTKFVRGVPTRVYKLTPGRRNEAIDLEVLNMAALDILGAGVTEHMEHWRRKVVEQGEAALRGEEPPKPLQRERGSSWVNRGWNE
jgi:phage terminase large subunit GpA-like protein